MFLFFYNYSAKKKKYTNQLEIFWKEVFKALKSAKKLYKNITIDLKVVVLNCINKYNSAVETRGNMINNKNK